MFVLFLCYADFLCQGDVLHQQAGLPIHVGMSAELGSCLTCWASILLGLSAHAACRCQSSSPVKAMMSLLVAWRSGYGVVVGFAEGWAGTLQLRTFVNIAKSLKAVVSKHLGSLGSKR